MHFITNWTFLQTLFYYFSLFSNHWFKCFFSNLSQHLGLSIFHPSLVWNKCKHVIYFHNLSYFCNRIFDEKQKCRMTLENTKDKCFDFDSTHWWSIHDNADLLQINLNWHSVKYISITNNLITFLYSCHIWIQEINLNHCFKFVIYIFNSTFGFDQIGFKTCLRMQFTSS